MIINIVKHGGVLDYIDPTAQIIGDLMICGFMKYCQP